MWSCNDMKEMFTYFVALFWFRFFFISARADFDFCFLVSAFASSSRHFLNDNNKYVRERERIRKNNAILSENAKER